MDNIEIANILKQIADILEIKGDSQYRSGAYRKAAQSIEVLPTDIKEIYSQGKLEKIPGVGKSIASHIKELIEKGKSKDFEDLKKEIPIEITELLKIEGLGAKKVKFLFDKFNVKTIPQLEKLLKTHKLASCPGWGKKSEENILKSLKFYKEHNQRFLLGEVNSLALAILDKLKTQKYITKCEICGSFRRKKETIGDLDFLATSKSPKKAIDFFSQMKEVNRIIAKGKTKLNVVLKGELEADLRVVSPESFGAALHYFTGSKSHNIAIRKIAKEKGLKINEYGVFKRKGKQLKKIAGQSEEEIFSLLGLSYVPPELRENRGEIEAAQKDQLPSLIKLKDIKGDLHMHTLWSDGNNSIREMAEASKKKGYKYIAITDHCSNLGVTHGLDSKRVIEQIKEIKQINSKIKDIHILSGIEVDIKKDGSLVLASKILEKLDFVIASIHSSFHLTKREMTERLIKAIKNPYVNVIGHPRGRIINKREAYDFDMEAILKEAKKRKVALEINAFWNRLDLDDISARQAKDIGTKLVISTDAHDVSHLSMMTYGLNQARRGWLEKKDVLNTFNLKDLQSFLSKKGTVSRS